MPGKTYAAVGRYRHIPKELLTEALPALEDAVRARQGQGRKKNDILTDPTNWGPFLKGYAARKKKNIALMGSR